MENLTEWSQQAQELYRQGNYQQAAECYEKAIEIEPENKSYYWQYGIILSVQGNLAEAQTIWLMAMFDETSEQIDLWSHQLIQLLTREAEQQEQFKQYQQARNLRQQIQQLAPTHYDNVFKLLLLTFQCDDYQGDELTQYNLADLLEADPLPTIDFNNILALIQKILEHDPLNPSLISLVKIGLIYPCEGEQKNSLLSLLYDKILDLGYFQKQLDLAINLINLILDLNQNYRDLVYHLSCFYQDCDRYEEGIEAARRYANSVEELPDRIFAAKGILKALMVTGGHWQESLDFFQEYEILLNSLLDEFPLDLNPQQTAKLFNSYFLAPYIQDNPKKNRTIQNRVAHLCQNNARTPVEDLVKKFQQRHQQRSRQSTQRPLKIGYLSYCFKRHSVGWLARSLIQHHDRDKFVLNGYFLANPNSSDPVQDWYVSQFNYGAKSQNPLELAQAIYEDEIDILVELDSITMDTNCCLVSLKPAPIQVTWLGWDASGIPCIDYFIADPYVLPESASDYYHEKIWRLPQTYIAVDGFEVGVPTLHRHDLGIEEDAILYYSAQRGYKRHLDTVRLQLQIIKAVPNSYFLIKGTSNTDAIQKIFFNLAKEEGVNPEQLRFLDVDLTEASHRANMGIADVVLDTYPYNGATTTLETLWMGIPLVTRVGEQFSARNSYTMMLNAGITEGLAWSDREYIDWGIRLGQDEQLRQTIAWKLRKSRQIAPLWNGKQFARDMEKAYEQMWQNYTNIKNESR